MTKTNGLWPETKGVSVLGIGLASVLALSSCAEGENGGDQAANGNDNDDAATQQTEPTSDVEGAPALSDIADDLHTGYDEAENVTMTATPSEIDDEDDDDSDEDDSDEDDEEDDDGLLDEELDEADPEEMDLVYRTATDGSIGEIEGTFPGVSENETTLLITPESLLISADLLMEDMEASVPEDEEDALDLSDAESELEGKWVDLGDDDILEDANEAIEEFEDDEWLENYEDEGEVAERDGETVWVYPGEDDEEELAVVPDEDDPTIYSVTESDVQMVLSDWDETELPDEPPEEDIVAMEDVQDLMLEAYTPEG